MAALTVNHHCICPLEAKIAIDIGETKDLCHLGSPHLPWIMGLRATGVQYQQLLQCHLGLIGQTDHSIPNKKDSTKRMELT